MNHTQLTHIAYKGMGSAITDLLGGKTQFVFAGRCRRMCAAVMQDLPTIAEAGVHGYQAASWFGWLAPAGTLQTIIGKMNTDVIASLSNADLRERLASDGAEPEGTSPREFETFLREEIAKWGKVIRAAGIVVQ